MLISENALICFQGDTGPNAGVFSNQAASARTGLDAIVGL